MPPPAPLAPLRSRAHLRLPPSPSPSPSPSPLLSRAPSRRWPPPLRASASGRGGAAAAAPASSAVDAFLSAAELLCLAPPAICSVVCAARLVFPLPPPTGAPASALVGGRLFVAQYVLLVGAMAIGSLIRRRQWGRLCQVGGGGGAVDARGVDFAGRIGEVEVSVRGVVAAVGVLSRTIEKLGVRFRVLRRTLRDRINETATIAQKNSEATRVLAAQEDHLEKELGEIQKVLYAMQEQQQKQLELILAIGEASRILDDKEDLLGATSEKEKKQADVKAETVTGGNNRP